MLNRTRPFHLLIMILISLTIFATACGRNQPVALTEVHTQIVTIQSTAIATHLPQTSTIEILRTPYHLPGDIAEFPGLLQPTAACQFPCFLGIVPGVSDYHSVALELSKIATSSTGNVRLLDGKIGNKFKLKYPDIKLDISISIRTFDESTVLEIVFHPTDTMARYYSIPQIIGYYDEPDAVLVFTLSEPYGDGVQPFDLVLDYSTRGFLLWYRNPYVTKKNNQITLCYRPEIAPEIFLWSPEQKRTFFDIAPFGKAESKDAKPLSEVATPPVDDIIKLLTSSDGFCVQSDVTNWKDITKYPD